MSHKFTAVLLTALLLLLAAGCSVSQGWQKPEQIDPYTHEYTPGPDYGADAYLAYSDGDYEQAARLYLAHLQARPDDRVAWYNLACCYGLLGRSDLAGKYLMLAYKAGYRELEHIQRDPDFDQVRATADFGAAMDSLRLWSERRAYYQGELRYITASHLLPYRLHLPSKFDPEKSYPLLIGLHGYGDQAANFSPLWRYMESEEVIFAVPEAPYPFTEGDIGFSWSPSMDPDDPRAVEAFTLLTEYITDLQEELYRAYNIDQTWLMGFSQGAYMGYLLALKNPWLFEGLIACGGGLIMEQVTEQDYAKAKNLKIIISHGKQDRVIGFEEALAAERMLVEKGFEQIRFDEFEAGHIVSPSAVQLWLNWLQE